MSAKPSKERSGNTSEAMRVGTDRSGWRWVVALVVVAGLMASTLALDRVSIERANRLHRAGDMPGAAEGYLQRAGGAASGTIAYNLGTTMLALDDPGADSLLMTATVDDDTSARQRAYRNLGLARLRRVAPVLETDTAAAILEESVAFGREALRLDPADADARWNLALAQRMLDSIARLQVNPDNRQSSGNDETPVDLVAMTRGPDGQGESGEEPPEPEEGESPGNRMGAPEGAREAWTTRDPGPLTREVALRIVGATRDDPEALVRGILWSRRPNVSWWNAESYPGGNW
jgi:hypothetical protein